MTVWDPLEKEWDAQLFNRKSGLAPMLGWRLAYHTLRSKGSQSGFPDRVLVRDRVIFAELKREKGTVSPSQREWLDGLASTGAEVYVWKPSDLDEIAEILSKRWRCQPNHILHRELSHTDCAWMPRSMWLPGVGRADEQTRIGMFACTVDESAGLANAPP